MFISVTVFLFILGNAYSQCATTNLIYPLNSIHIGTYKTTANIESAGEVISNASFVAEEEILLNTGFSVTSNVTFSASNLNCADAPEIPIIGENTIFEEDQAILQALLLSIQIVAQSTACTNADEWKFIAIGNQPCGEPNSYIAYSTQIDENTFLYDVERYTNATSVYNNKWDISSGCDVTPTPVGISCVNGEAVFSY